MELIVMVGDYAEGFQALGPFSDKARADEVAASYRADFRVEVLPMVRVPGYDGDDPHVVLAGDLASGVKVYGTFGDADEAQAWADVHCPGPAWPLALS